MLNDAEIHEWLEEGQNGSLFSDDEIQELLIALAKGRPEFTLDEAHFFLNWCVRQVSGAALVSLCQKGLIVPTEWEGDNVSFTANPEISWPLDGV